MHTTDTPTMDAMKSSKAVFCFQNQLHAMANAHMQAYRKSNNKPTNMHWQSPALMVADQRGILASSCKTIFTLHATATTSSAQMILACIMISLPAQQLLPCWTQSNPQRPQKVYDKAIAMQTLLCNLLIDTILDDYIAELWDLDEGYNQSTFHDIIFHIFDCFAFISETMFDDNKFIFD